MLGSILYRPYKDTFKVELRYPSSYFPLKNGDSYFSDSDYSFHALLDSVESHDLSDNASALEYSYTSNLPFSENNFFNLRDHTGFVSYLQYIYSSSYLSEVKIKNVPNYRNTQFSNRGCTPTSAARYFAYLEDRGFNVVPSAYSNLPIKHTENKSLVNNFIRYLGTNYVKTTDYGTLITNISSGYSKYLIDIGFGQYTATEINNFNYYSRIILETANPVPLVINGHSRIGIGYRFLSNSSGATNPRVIVNQVLNDERVEAYIPAEKIVRYYIISK